MAKLPSQLTYNDLNGREAAQLLTDWFSQLLSNQSLLQPHLTLPNAKLTLAVRIDIDMYVGGTVPVDTGPERAVIQGTVGLSNTVQGQDVAAQPAYSPANAGLAGAGGPQHSTIELSAVVNAAPVPGGVPPDQLREQHNLPVPRPGYGPRDTGSHLFLADVVEQTGRTAEQQRRGPVADGYTFATAPVPVVPIAEQSIPLQDGSIDIDLTGQGRMHQGDQIITAGTHRASAKVQGDQKGHKYGSVTGTYDPGPAGLARPGRPGGLGGDGRPRLSPDSFK